MRVLFVAAHPPLPRDNGGRLRTFHLLEQLAARAQVTLVCLDHEPGSPSPPCDAAAIAEALPALEDVQTIPAPTGNRRAIQLTALATRSSYTMRLYRSAELDAAVATAIERLRPQLVHCDSLFCAQVHRTGAPAGTWVLALHNFESLLKQRLAAIAESPARRVLYRAEARALETLERRYVTAFDHCVAVSERERAEFARLNPSTVTIPNGVEPRPRPAAPTKLAPGEPLRLLFVGSLNYEPNREGLEWFAREVLPRAQARLHVEVEAAGPGRRGPELPGITYLGRVEDLEPVYARAHAAIVPLRAGAGSRLKVLEALALGVPLVATALGAEGFDLIDGRHALIADGADALVERLARLDASLRGDGQLAAALVDAGYGFALPYFWPAIGERLAQTYSGWASASTAAHSP